MSSTSSVPATSLTSSPKSTATNENEKITGTDKERLTSPAPLGVADSNVAAPVANAGPVANGTKAVKRTAAGGLSGAEKRKKALKRL